MSRPNVVDAQLETPAAGFVTMLMDRLQSLEQRVQQMEHVKDQLEASRCEYSVLQDRIHALERPLRLTSNLRDFSDGLQLQEYLWDEPAVLYVPTEGLSIDCSIYPLDNLHAKAGAFVDRHIFDFGYIPSPIATLGPLEIGTDGEITTVEEMITAMATYCKAWKEVDNGLRLDASNGWKFDLDGIYNMI
jgi:hypothetical protein